jgi:hypothetical protein
MRMKIACGTLLAAAAIMVVSAFVMGCQAECVRECKSTMEACFEGAKTSEEREQCMTNNGSCVKACSQSGTRVHWEFKPRGKGPAAPADKPPVEIKPDPPKEKETKPEEGFEEDEGFE